jgi:Bacterial regulatory helix-turn-helix protein, lysR family
MMHQAHRPMPIRGTVSFQVRPRDWGAQADANLRDSVLLGRERDLEHARGRALQCSQPALTPAIRNLEDKLGGGPLIHRERGNTHLTELGRINCPYCSERDDWIQSMVADGLGFTFIPEFAVRLPDLEVRRLIQP